MKNVLKSTFAVLFCQSLLILLFLNLTPGTRAYAAGAVENGKCGNDARWTYYNDGTLVISGSGAMTNYSIPASPQTDARPYAKYLSGIRKIVIEDGITQIGDFAFFAFIQASSVQIAETVNTIGYGAFMGSGIETLTTPSSLQIISTQAFELCTYLTIVDVKSACTIGQRAFGGCKNLNTVFFDSGESLTLSDQCFAECPKLERMRFGSVIVSFPTTVYMNNETGEIGDPIFLTIPQNLVIYGHSGTAADARRYASRWNIPFKSYDTFGNCGDEGSNLIWTLDENNVLTIRGHGKMRDYTRDYGNEAPWLSKPNKVIIETGATSIGNYAFCKCEELTSITLPSSLKSIGENAFIYCSKLPSITLPLSLESIGKYAFNDCSTLTSIELPSGLTNIAEGTFGSSGLTEITIPSGVTRIKAHAFSDCKALKNVTILSGVQSIEDYAFSRCNGLESISIPSSATNIGEEAFYQCGALTDITIPSSVANIGANAFYGCTGLTRVNIQDLSSWCAVTLESNYSNPLAYAGDLFLNGVRVTDLVIPSGVKSIGNGVFLGCRSITRVSIPNGVTSIGFNSFGGCSGVTEITIPSSVKTIADGAFSGCRELTSISIPSAVTSIQDGTFYNCEKLASIELPVSVTSIGNSAFLNCSSLADVYYSGTEEEANFIQIDTNNTPLNSATWHYRHITKEETLSLPGVLTTIQSEAFSCVSARRIVVPPSVTVIGSRAFADCKYLEEIFFEGSPQSIAEDILSGCNIVKIYVIKDSTAENWATQQGLPVVYR